MSAMVPKPLSVTDSTVTLNRVEWEAFLDRLEDLEDQAVIAASLAERARIGDAEYSRLCFTAEEVARMIDDDVSSVTIWREREGLTEHDLAAAAGISQSYLAEIETGRKTGSVAAIAALAKVLRVPIEHLCRPRAMERTPPDPQRDRVSPRLVTREKRHRRGMNGTGFIRHAARMVDEVRRDPRGAGAECAHAMTHPEELHHVAWPPISVATAWLVVGLALGSELSLRARASAPRCRKE